MRQYLAAIALGIALTFAGVPGTAIAKTRLIVNCF